MCAGGSGTKPGGSSTCNRYLGLALAFAHQIFTGIAFIGHPLVRALWIGIWVATAGMVLVFRVAQPIWRSLRHQLRVVEVRAEAPGVVSVVCQGRHLEQLAVSGGQFFLWHFLTRGLWWQGHPYSLSALPQPPHIRVTIKGLGDQSWAAASLRPGTWVAIEGPYGAFTHHARTSDRVALFAAGVGITPVRALLEDLPPEADVVVVVRASTAGDIASSGDLGPGRPFRIGIADPRSPIRLAAVVELTGAIATSGTYERGDHLIDPHTGHPAARVASASVTGPDLGLADALATAVAVAGEPGLALIEPLDGYEGLIISSDGSLRWTRRFPLIPLGDGSLSQPSVRIRMTRTGFQVVRSYVLIPSWPRSLGR